MDNQDKQAVRAYLTRIHREADAIDNQYIISQLKVIYKVLDKLWGNHENN